MQFSRISDYSNRMQVTDNFTADNIYRHMLNICRCIELTANRVIHYFALKKRRLDFVRETFYRATRMHSADYAVARYLSVC